MGARVKNIGVFTQEYLLKLSKEIHPLKEIKSIAELETHITQEYIEYIVGMADAYNQQIKAYEDSLKDLTDKLTRLGEIKEAESRRALILEEIKTNRRILENLIIEEEYYISHLQKLSETLKEAPKNGDIRSGVSEYYGELCKAHSIRLRSYKGNLGAIGDPNQRVEDLDSVFERKRQFLENSIQELETKIAQMKEEYTQILELQK